MLDPQSTNDLLPLGLVECALILAGCILEHNLIICNSLTNPIFTVKDI